jgi:ABC-2 type transport system permease protein
MMFRDILTVMWKERKELFTERETVRGTLASFLGPLIMTAAMGIVAPLLLGRAWVESAASLATALFVSLMFGGMTAGSVAGERERHTLETLLASRLSDQGILLGKVGIAVAFAWASATGTVLLGLVTVNVVHWAGGLQFYPPMVIVADLLVSPLAATLSAAMGVFVSLKAATVREAEQNIMALLAGGTMVLVWAPILVLKTIPGLEARFSELLTSLDITKAALVLLSVLIALDVGFLVAAMHRFQRARLIVV